MPTSYDTVPNNHQHLCRAAGTKQQPVNQDATQNPVPISQQTLTPTNQPRSSPDPTPKMDLPDNNNASPDPIQTTGHQQPPHQPTIKPTMGPAHVVPNPALFAGSPTSLGFLRPQGSIYCQNESILQQADSEYRIEDSLLSNKVGIAGMHVFYETTVDRHNELQEILSDSDVSGEPLRKKIS